MITRVSGSRDRIWYRIWYRIWVCLRLQWEKAGPSRGRDYLGRWSRPRPLLAAHLANLCVYSEKKAGLSRGRARPFSHCKRGPRCLQMETAIFFLRVVNTYRMAELYFPLIFRDLLPSCLIVTFFSLIWQSALRILLLLDILNTETRK